MTCSRLESNLGLSLNTFYVLYQVPPESSSQHKKYENTLNMKGLKLKFYILRKFFVKTGFSSHIQQVNPNFTKNSTKI